MQWYIGCSGFHYKHWKEKFYPPGMPAKDWFGYYSSFFDTLELNVSHYRFPTGKMLDEWYLKSKPGFRFAVKVYKGITHYKKLHDCKAMVNDFYGIVGDHLKEKAACILFQFPESFRFNDTNMSRILDNLDPRFQNVVEFRHESWWNEEVFSIFSKNDIVFCGVSHPDLPSQIVTTSATIYHRMHGSPRLYSTNYSREKLISTRDAIKKCESIKHAFIYFNNDFNAYAVKNALKMKDLI